MNELKDKHRKVVELTKSIERAEANLAKDRNPKIALEIQRLKGQRRELQALIRPRLVA